MQMTEERAREILSPEGEIIFFSNGGFTSNQGEIYFDPDGRALVMLNSVFTADELQALAFLMRNHQTAKG